MQRPVTRLAWVMILAGATFSFTVRTVGAAGDDPVSGMTSAPAFTVPPTILVAPTQPVAPTIPAPLPTPRATVRRDELLPPAGAMGAISDEENPGGKQSNGSKGEPPELTLGMCLAIALERQPSLKAARSSLAATEAGFRSLTNFGTVGTLFSPDLDIRKQQAQRGLAAASAEYQKVHNEIVQDVTRLYYSAVYAREQQAIADDLVGQLKELVEIVRDILKTAKDPADLGGLSYSKLLAMEIGLQTAQELQAEARVGQKRALAALRQLMAVEESSFPFRLKDSELPLMEQRVPLSKEQVVEMALSRRPELALAAAGVDAFRLEVYAQAKLPFRRVVPTLASASDLHAREIPPAMRGNEYRPGGIAPEMPPQLVGSKSDRVNRAMTFSQRAEAVFESARTLVTLEAENGFLEFELASEKLTLAKAKRASGQELQKSTRENAPNIKAKDLILQAEVAAAKAQSDYVQAKFQYLQALAALERITAGGIRPAFPDR